jgi:hypothetical protein
MKMFVRLSLLVITTALLASCQQDPDAELDLPILPPVVPPATVDSTLLVKSLTTSWYEETDRQGYVTVIKETYTYDTVNRRITILREGDLDYGTSSTSVFSYNENASLKQVVVGYPTGYSPTDEDIKQVDFTYDAAGVLANVKMTWGDGHFDNKPFVKSSIGGGYRLTFTQPNQTYEAYVQDFDNVGHATITHANFMIDNGSGPELKTESRTQHYDANGYVFKSTFEGSLRNTGATSGTNYELLGRETRGDNLFKLRRLLLGKALDFAYIDEGLALCNLDIFDNMIEFQQYSPYPITGAKALIFPGGVDKYVDVDIKATFDAKGRLTKYEGFYPEIEIFPIVHELEYYK